MWLGFRKKQVRDGPEEKVNGKTQGFEIRESCIRSTFFKAYTGCFMESGLRGAKENNDIIGAFSSSPGAGIIG